MKRLTVLALIVLALTGCQIDKQEGAGPISYDTFYTPIVNGTRQPQVVDLTDSQIRAIGWLYPARSPSLAFCTGTLVAPDLVVTARHCISGLSGGDIGFGVGLEPTEPEGLFLSSAIYPNFQVDAAMILLAEDATAGDVEITPIPINQVAIDETFIGTAVQAGGYGDTYDETRTGRWFATVYVYDVDDRWIVIDGRGEQGICFGDSGSGLIHTDAEGNPVVLAVEAEGDSTCVDIDYMTRLDTIYDWIGPILAGEVPEDPCDGVSREGRCTDNVAETCPRGTLVQMDCTILGAECTYIEEAERYGCACGELGEFEWCDGDILESCRDGRIVQRNCLTRGGVCGWVGEEEGYDCVDSTVCRPEDETGRCEGTTAINCSDGRTTREICHADGMICTETEEGALCIDSGAEEETDEDTAFLDDASEEPDAGDAAPFPDLGDLADETDTGSGSQTAGSSEDDCGGCATARQGPADHLLWLALMAMLIAIRRRRSG
ncbi:MAG: trypsin-like serine protease [Bradymonadales bacterium]|nr:trypsin-like serine protease [Bradymonadales bacterium]